MWEYRLTWAKQPSWWDQTWKHGFSLVEGLAERKKAATDGRADPYLVIPNRLDLGLKLRGGGQFEIKVLHQRAGGWELWEKNPIFSWDDLERTRALQLAGLPVTAVAQREAASPWHGFSAVLADAGLAVHEVNTIKRRVQSDAGHLLKPLAAYSGSAAWLAELAVVGIPDDNGRRVFSLCLETMDPQQGAIDVVPRDGALCAGYPELLARQLAGTL